jgi:hypothetical protein
MLNFRPHMPNPYRADTRWQQLGGVTETDSSGQSTTTLHFVELESMEEFTCSVTGRGSVDGGYFIAALQATVAALAKANGLPDQPGAKFVPKNSNH